MLRLQFIVVTTSSVYTVKAMVHADILKIILHRHINNIAYSELQFIHRDFGK